MLTKIVYQFMEIVEKIAPSHLLRARRHLPSGNLKWTSEMSFFLGICGGLLLLIPSALFFSMLVMSAHSQSIWMSQIRASILIRSRAKPNGALFVHQMVEFKACIAWHKVGQSKRQALRRRMWLLRMPSHMPNGNLNLCRLTCQNRIFRSVFFSFDKARCLGKEWRWVRISITVINLKS